jgi:periplasmic copper chaperone A
MLRPRSRVVLGLAVVAVLLGAAASAAAHIQVSPTLAAPEDAVRFTVLVPGERSDAATVKVALKVPAGVLPYSYGEAPGWSRKLVLAKDQSVAQVVWTGRTASDGFAEFSFLAATPPKPGVLEWKALQFYSDGQVVRWIGSPSSENPAPRTVVEAGAPLQNAGGEGASGENREAALAPLPEAATSSGDDPDWIARGLALAALLFALAGVGALLIRGRGER